MMVVFVIFLIVTFFEVTVVNVINTTDWLTWIPSAPEWHDAMETEWVADTNMAHIHTACWGCCFPAPVSQFPPFRAVAFLAPSSVLSKTELQAWLGLVQELRYRWHCCQLVWCSTRRPNKFQIVLTEHHLWRFISFVWAKNWLQDRLRRKVSHMAFSLNNINIFAQYFIYLFIFLVLMTLIVMLPMLTQNTIQIFSRC